MRTLIQGHTSYDVDMIWTMYMIYKGLTVSNHLKTKHPREDDSIPLADGDPADFVEDSLVSEDKRKVGGGFVSNEQTMMMEVKISIDSTSGTWVRSASEAFSA